MKLTIKYFDIEGVAESVRLALVLATAWNAAGSIEWDDVRVKFDEWPALKPSTPYGQLPVMTIEDGDATTAKKTRTQSEAMLRYVGALDKTSKLYPADSLLDIDETIGVINDMNKSWEPALYLSMAPERMGHEKGWNQTPEGKATIETMRKTWIKEHLPRFLGYLDDILGDKQFLCSDDAPTIADCMCVPVLRKFTRGHIDHVDKDCVEQASPKLAAYVKRFCALKEVAGRYHDGLGAAA